MFDGVCVLCTRSMRFILRRERLPLLAFASLQSEVGRRLTDACGLNPTTTDSVVLIEDGTAYVESEAAVRIARYLRLPWRAAALLRFVPALVRDPVYRLVARHRYRVFGRLDAEWSPSPELERRFL